MRASYDEAAVRFLRRRDDDDQPVDLNERSPELGLRFKDLAVLGSLMEAGADLSQPRHVICYLYAPTKEVAEAMAHDVEENDFSATVREPLPEYPDQWRVACEKQRSLRRISSVRRTTSSKGWTIDTRLNTTAGRPASSARCAS
jgi:hypothetical protein